LIQFRDEAALYVTPSDITDNPRKLRILQVDSAHLSKSLETAAAVALPFPVAADLQLYPARDSIAMEDARCPYAGVLVTRSEDKTAPWTTKLVRAYHSSTVKQFVLTQFKDSVRRPW
jgi:D-methionine transport system substrate-binding protein